jgi:hypothetical protein
MILIIVILLLLLIVCMQVAIVQQEHEQEHFLNDGSIGVGESGGLGDSIVDIIGFCTLCDHLRLSPIIFWCPSGYEMAWGKLDYDVTLLTLPCAIALCSDIPDRGTLSLPDARVGAVTLAPYYMAQALNSDTIYTTFTTRMQQVMCSGEITTILNVHTLQQAVGIHIRRSDRVGTSNDRQEQYMAIDEVEFYDNQMKNVITKMIEQGHSTFFVCSDSNKDRLALEEWILLQPSTRLIKLPYGTSHKAGFDAIMDLFALSRCHRIIQGCKWSGFSFVAAAIGNKPLVNLGKQDVQQNINMWTKVVTVLNSNLEPWKKASNVPDLTDDHSMNVLRQFLSKNRR